MQKFWKRGAAVILAVLLTAGGYYAGVTQARYGGSKPVTIEKGKRGALDDKRILSQIHQFEQVIKNNYLFDYKKEDLETGLYKGLFAGLNDPYSTFFTGEEFKQLMEETSGEFAGVGIVVSAGEDNLITVVSPIEGTPGEKAGILSGDKILAIDGEAIPASRLQEASQKMRGKVGTKVVLTIRHKDAAPTDTKEITITREMIHVKSVSSQMLEPGLAYITISSFDENTGKDFKSSLEALQKKGAKKLVLDLRSNPGGLLATCEQVADLLLKKATIVTTVDKKGHKEIAVSDEKSVDIPMVVLVNEGSASASEILLGALRDNKRAVSVGTKTFGKGIVQQIYPLGKNIEDGGFKLTMAEYLTPNGEKIHKKGITPDIVVELSKDTKGIGPRFLKTDNQLQRAIEEVKKE